MNIYEDITAIEALGIAIRTEIDSQLVYEELSDLCNDELLKERFLNLSKEERKHQLIFEKKYADMFPEVELVLPPTQLPHKAIDPDLKKKLSIKDVLLMAIDEEKRACEFYGNYAKNVKDLSGQRMFKLIADMEYQHQMILEAEYEVLKKYPNYYGDVESWDVESRLKAEKIKRT
ncbi:MAG TPA: ferritin family protein [Ignavibacteria bacterium]|nr:ferritin family protein [Ignavibacteria bacterium]